MKQNIIVLVGILLFIVLSFVNIPFSSSELTQQFIQGILTRFIGAALFAYIVFTFGYTRFLKWHTLSTKTWLVILPAFLIVINNFPFSAYFAGRAIVTESSLNVGLFILFVLSISVFEEFIFRGIILQLMLEKWEQSKSGIFQALLYSAAVFAAFHGLNALVGGNPLGTILQVGYSFLTGLLFGFVYLKTKTIWYPVILHTIYNIGGLSFSLIGTILNQWDLFTIVLTTILSIVTIGFYLWQFKRSTVDELILEKPLQ